MRNSLLVLHVTEVYHYPGACQLQIHFGYETFLKLGLNI